MFFFILIFTCDSYSLREKCPYLEFFWSIFPRILTEYGEIRNISPYLVRMRENTGQKNSKYGYFSRSDYYVLSETFDNRLSQISYI